MWLLCVLVHGVHKESERVHLQKVEMGPCEMAPRSDTVLYACMLFYPYRISYVTMRPLPCPSSYKPAALSWLPPPPDKSPCSYFDQDRAHAVATGLTGAGMAVAPGIVKSQPVIVITKWRFGEVSVGLRRSILGVGSRRVRVGVRRMSRKRQKHSRRPWGSEWIM